MRPVLDLSILNQYLVVPHFKMETNKSIKTSIYTGMWTTSINTYAYFHVPIAFPFRKFLCLAWKGKVYSFRAMPFGHSTAPLVFTKKKFQAVMAHLHCQSILSIHIWTIP
jgi:hypothetical protein